MKKWMFLLVVAVLGFGFWGLQNNDVRIVGCTEESRICPDGSTVGRTGLNCEFEACPIADSLNDKKIHAVNDDFESRLDVVVGDTVGGFVVEEIDEGPESFTIKYSGEAIVEGKYEVDAGLGNTSCIYVGDSSKHLIPRVAIDNRTPWFCFHGETMNKSFEALAEYDGRIVSVKIGNYIEVYAPRSVVDGADFLKLVESSSF